MRAVVLVAAMALGWLVMFDTRAAREADLPPSQWDAHLIELDVRALDTAYQQRIMALYQTWMVDYADSVQTPSRVATGARNARAAYIHAMTQIEARRSK